MPLWKLRYGGLRLPKLPSLIAEPSPPFCDEPAFLQVGMLGQSRRLIYANNPVTRTQQPSAMQPSPQGPLGVGASPSYASPLPNRTLSPSRYLKFPSDLPPLPCAGVCPGSSVQSIVVNLASGQPNGAGTSYQQPYQTTAQIPTSVGQSYVAGLAGYNGNGSLIANNPPNNGTQVQNTQGALNNAQNTPSNSSAFSAFYGQS